MLEVERLETSFAQNRSGMQHAIQGILPSLASLSPKTREEIIISLPTFFSDYFEWIPWVSGLALWDKDDNVRSACAKTLMDLLPDDRRIWDVLRLMCLSAGESPRLRLDIVEYLEKQPGVDIEMMREVLREIANQTSDSEIADIAQSKLAVSPYSDAGE